MNKNLTCILKSFSKNEWNEFGDFISSPYFTKSRDYGQLFKFLKKYLTSEINKAELSIEDIQISLRPLLSDRTINNRLSELSKLAERFLRIKNVEKNPIKNYSCLYEELISRNLYCNFYKSFKTKKNKFSPVDVNDFIPYCGIIQAEGFYHRSMQNFPETINQFSKQAEYVSAFSLDRLLYYYTEYFLFDKWKIKYSAVNFKTFFESVDFDKIAEEYKNNGNKIYAPFLLRYYMLKALQNTDDRNLAAGARIFFENNKSLFSINVKIDYFQKMQAYYNSLINKGDEDAIKEAHQLHKERIEDSETIDFSIMQYPVTEFRDFVIVGLNAGDFKWVEDFIDKYSSKLHPSIRNEEITSAKVIMYIIWTHICTRLNCILNWKWKIKWSLRLTT